MSYEYYVGADFSTYEDEWVAILGDKVVAHSRSFKELAEKVDREFKGKKALLSRIPAKTAQLL